MTLTEEQNATYQFTGGLTLGHVVMGSVFFMPIMAIISEVHRAGGGALRYLLGAPLGLGLGALLLYFDRTSGKHVWLRSQEFAVSTLNLIAFGVFALHGVWLLIGGIAGSILGAFLVHHVS